MCDTSSSHLSFASNNNSPDIDIYAHKRRRLLDDNSDDNTLSNTCDMSNTLVYALSFLFLKTVNYTLFFWLSYYLHESFHISKSKSDMISCLYDVGGIIGSILTGVLLLRLQKYNVITVVMLSLSIIPLLFLKYTNVISYSLLHCWLDLNFKSAQRAKRVNLHYASVRGTRKEREAYYRGMGKARTRITDSGSKNAQQTGIGSK